MLYLKNQAFVCLSPIGKSYSVNLFGLRCKNEKEVAIPRQQLDERRPYQWSLIGCR
jgi:hypothetical protein